MLYILNRQALISSVLFLSNAEALMTFDWYVLMLIFTSALTRKRFAFCAYFFPPAWLCFLEICLFINTDIWFMYCFQMYNFMYTHIMHFVFLWDHKSSYHDIPKFISSLFSLLLFSLFCISNQWILCLCTSLLCSEFFILLVCDPQ